MPFYKLIDASSVHGQRTIEGLQRLRSALRAPEPDESADEMALQAPRRTGAPPTKTLDRSLIIASWNLRELGGTKSGGRDLEALLYLAEIISHFDLVAIQEVRDDLDALERLMSILGSWWKFLVSDVTLGAAGNRERHAFIYDTRKLRFGGLAGELVPEASKKTDGTLGADFAFARTPYLAGFQAGWFKFTICTQHFYYGKARSDDPQRVADAREVARLLGLRRRSADRWANNAVLLGDFNVFKTTDETFKALTRADFQVPAGLERQYTNAKLDKPFDQMCFLAPDVERQVQVARAGVFPYLRLRVPRQRLEGVREQDAEGVHAVAHLQDVGPPADLGRAGRGFQRRVPRAAAGGRCAGGGASGGVRLRAAMRLHQCRWNASTNGVLATACSLW